MPYIRTESLLACFDPMLTCLFCNVLQIRGISWKALNWSALSACSLLDKAAQSRSSLFLAHSIIITMAICNRIHSRDYSEERYIWYEVLRHLDVFSQSDPTNLQPNLCDYSVLWGNIPLCGWPEQIRALERLRINPRARECQ